MTDIVLRMKSETHVIAHIEGHDREFVCVDPGTFKTTKDAMEHWAVASWHRLKGHKPPWKLNQPTVEWVNQPKE